MLANGKKNNQPTENLLNQIRILVTFAPPPPYLIILFLFNISLSLSSLALSLKLTVATTTSQSGHVTKAIKWVPSQTCVNVCSIAQCKQLANHLAIDCSVACICLGLQKQVKKKKAHIHIQIVTYRQQYLIQTVGTIIYYYTYFTFFPSFIVFLIIDK